MLSPTCWPLGYGYKWLFLGSFSSRNQPGHCDTDKLTRHPFARGFLLEASDGITGHMAQSHCNSFRTGLC